MEIKIALFRGKGIRKTLNNNESWFVIADVVGILTDSSDPAILRMCAVAMPSGIGGVGALRKSYLSREEA
jgi:hypothetical protein